MLIQPYDEDHVSVSFIWNTKHGKCYDCGAPAAFVVLDAYGFRGIATEHTKRCAICAANAAADGERVARIEPLD